MIIANPNHLKLKIGDYYPYVLDNDNLVHIRESGKENSVMCKQEVVTGNGDINFNPESYYITAITCPKCKHLYRLAQLK